MKPGDDSFDSLKLPGEEEPLPPARPARKKKTVAQKPVGEPAQIPEPPEKSAPPPAPVESLAPKSKVTALPAREVCRHFALSGEARKLLQDDPPAYKFLNTLSGRRLFADAVRFLAYALPKREAVWWACQCARRALGPEPAPEAAAALEAAEQWAAQPTEENRRKTLPAAETADIGTPAGCAAVAAAWTGGSLLPPEEPPVPPGEFLTARAVAGSVLLAAAQVDPERVPEPFPLFLQLGVQVANGKSRWKRKNA